MSARVWAWAGARVWELERVWAPARVQRWAPGWGKVSARVWVPELGRVLEWWLQSERAPGPEWRRGLVPQVRRLGLGWSPCRRL